MSMFLLTEIKRLSDVLCSAVACTVLGAAHILFCAVFLGGLATGAGCRFYTPGFVWCIHVLLLLSAFVGDWKACFN